MRVKLATIRCDHHLLIRNDNIIHIHHINNIKRKKQNYKKTPNNVNSISNPDTKKSKVRETFNKHKIIFNAKPTNINRNHPNLNPSSRLITRTPPKSNPKLIILMKTQEIKNNPITNLIKKSLLDLPTPTSISFLWNFGFLLGFTLTLQIISGLVVSIIYTADTSLAFSVIVKIIRDNDTGWASRLIHTNGASLFFVLIYIHTARGIYFSSPSNQPKVWISGVVIILITIGTAFLGYVLPWGQISFWGATVITGVLSAIPLVGNDLVVWIWGGPSVSQPTLNRFFSLHFLLPIVLMVLILIHLILLHEKGSSNPNNTKTETDKIKFHPSFSVKDLLPGTLISIVFMLIISNYPNILGDVENFNPANPLVTPVHIQPEWYFLFAYVILRSIPSKLGGVVALAASIIILAILVIKKNIRTKFNPIKKIVFWLFSSTVVILTWIGAKTVERPFEGIGQIYTILYFASVISI